MMIKTAVLVMSVLLLLAFGAMAADVTGKWTAQVPGRDGETREATFTFKVNGDKLEGSMSGRQGRENPIADGKISGDTVTFTVAVARGGGGDPMKQTYTGKVSGNEILFKRQGGQGQAREFTAKRAQ